MCVGQSPEVFHCVHDRTKTVYRFRQEALEIAEAVRKGIAR